MAITWSTVMRPFSGWMRARAASASPTGRSSATRRSCTVVSSVTEEATGTTMSGVRTHASWLYGLIVGSSSVRASLMRTYALAWLSAR